MPVPTRHKTSRLLHTARPQSRLLAVLAAVALLVGAVVTIPSSGASGASGPTCGSTTARRADGTAWVCTFDDEFSGTSIDRALWTVQTTANGGFRAGDACLFDNPGTVSVSDGRLNLTVRKLSSTFVCKSSRTSFRTSWAGASMYTRYFGQAYGRFAIRARFPEANGRQGLQSALWTYPRSMTMMKAITGTNEIDIAEAYSRYPDLVSPTVHAFWGGKTEACSVPDYGAAFHTYAVEWSVTNATFYYDGVKCLSAGRTGTSQPFLVALTQGLGVKANLYNASTPSPATMQVDWVRVWK
jgi:beta-glucanase (GH16 family)